MAAEIFEYLFNTKADPRTDSWFLVHSPWPPFIICFIYILFCWNAERLTQNLPTFTLRWPLIIYNFALVLLSAYMSYEFFMSAYLAGYSLTCEPLDRSYDPLPLRMASVCWWYFFSKYIELLDTVFFALRKKFSQLSFLHVYHHATMLINWWFGVKYVAGGNSFFIGLINSSIHVVMYFYYGMSAIGPHMQKYLWWKKYLTVMQITQFFLILIHSSTVLFVDCDYPKFLLWMVVGYQVSLIVLFSMFYVKRYKRKSE